MVPSVFVEILRESNPEELETSFPRLMETLSRVADDLGMLILYIFFILLAGSCVVVEWG